MDASPTYPDLERLMRHSEWLRALARRLVRDTAAADDLVQETWLAAMKSPPDPNRPARPWLAGVMRRLVSMRARSEARRGRRQARAARTEPLPSTAELVESVDTGRRLAEQVLDLSEPYRTTLLLRYYHDLSSAEIARRQGIPSGTVRWRLKRGLDEMRENLDREWGDRRSWCLALAGIERAVPLSTGAASAGVGGGTWLAWAVGLLTLLIGGVLGVRLLDQRTRGEVLAAGPELNASDETSEFRTPLASQGSAATRAPLAVTAESRAPRSALRLLRADALPAAGHLVVWRPEDGEQELLQADDQGYLRPQHGAPRGELFVQRPGSFIHRASIDDWSSGEYVVTLPAGKTLEGQLLMDGGHVGSGHTLEIDFDELLWGGVALPADLPSELGNPRRARTLTDSEGRFVFHGLESRWSGELWLGDEFRLADGSLREHVGAPQSGLEVRVDSMPRVTGRLLDDKGAALQGARLVVGPPGGPQPQFFETDAEGRFAGTIKPIEGLSVNVVAQTPAGAAGYWRLSKPADPDTSLELGDLILEPNSWAVIAVQDDQGFAVSGARVEWRADRMVNSFTDEYGRTSVPLGGLGSRMVRVRSARHLPHEAQLFGGPAATPIVLRSAATLNLVVLDSEDRPLPGVQVELSSSGRIFALGQGRKPPPELKRALLGHVVRSQPRPGRSSILLQTSPEGRLEVPGLEPGIAPELAVWGLDPVPFVTQRLDPLEGGAGVLHELRVAQPLRRVEGHVLDEDGGILVGALVRAAGRNETIRTGLDGRVFLGWCASDTLDLNVQKRSFVPRSIEDFELPPAGELFEIVLRRGRRVLVHVRDRDERPVRGGRVSFVSELGPTSAHPEFLADQHIEGLPEAELELRLDLAGSVYKATLPVQVPDGEFVFRVPVHGSLQASWTLEQELGLLGGVRLVARPVGGGPDVIRGLGKRVPGGVAELRALPVGSFEVTLEVRPLARPRSNWTVLARSNQAVHIGAGRRSEVILEAMPR